MCPHGCGRSESILAEQQALGAMRADMQAHGATLATMHDALSTELLNTKKV